MKIAFIFAKLLQLINPIRGPYARNVPSWSNKILSQISNKFVLCEITICVAPFFFIVSNAFMRASSPILSKLEFGSSSTIFTWDREQVGQYIGYLPQDIELFAGTVKENIARMGEIDDLKVIECAKNSGAHNLILHLPLGYDTPILQTQLGLY